MTPEQIAEFEEHIEARVAAAVKHEMYRPWWHVNLPQAVAIAFATFSALISAGIYFVGVENTKREARTAIERTEQIDKNGTAYSRHITEMQKMLIDTTLSRIASDEARLIKLEENNGRVDVIIERLNNIQKLVEELNKRISK